VELTHRFTVPATVEETWAAFNDIESVASCFPGAVVTSMEGDTFQGSCKVKLGPIALVYNGSGTFVEKDESAHRMKIEAKGKDKRGNGTAGANVSASMTANGDSTDVEVITDLAITGKPAQFGRGVMQDVSDKLLGQFVACLEKKVGAPAEEPPAPAAAGDHIPAAEQVAPAKPPLGGGSKPPLGGGSRPSPSGSTEPTPRAVPGAGDQPPSWPRPAPRSAPGESGDALDLGATVLPVMLKLYWKQALGVVLGLLVLRRLIRR
jgi:carbon monoxide dehydrogenase subunit G